MAKTDGKDEGLKRLGGGRWQTRDERFLIEPQSGTWVVVDADQTDDLGLALVRGPFGSLGAAKVAIEAARESAPAASPLAERIAKLADRPAGKPVQNEKRVPATKGSTTPKVAKPATKPEPPAEPRWIAALAPAERRRAKRLIDRLTEAGAPDPDGTVRRDLVGDVPAVAAFAVARALAGLDAETDQSTVARLLADGRDEELDVRWRLVDGDDRVISLDLGSGKRP